MNNIMLDFSKEVEGAHGAAQAGTSACSSLQQVRAAPCARR
jgi:hypothetical protein